MGWYGGSNGVGLRERISEILSWNCSESCMSDGLIERANARVLDGRFPWVTVRDYSHSPYGGAYGTHTHIESVFDEHYVVRREDKELWGEFLEILSNLQGYPIIDEYVYDDVANEYMDSQIDVIVQDNNITDDTFRQALDRLGIDYWLESGSYLYFDGEVDDAIAMARQMLQTWDTHYNAGEHHMPKYCWRCIEAGMDGGENE